VSFDDSRSEKTLKKQYRALALEHHPDKGGDEEKFIKINASYEFISKYSESILDHKPIENRKEKYQNGGFV
jgi:DnaJ-class molecular chaperone